MSPELPECEGALRGWLRGRAPIATLVGTRTYFSMPTQDDPIAPFLLFYRVGGAPDEFFQDYPDFIIECWGATKFAASDLAKVVANEILLTQWERPTVVDDVKILSGTVNYGPVPNGGNSKYKRYRLDTSFHMRKA